MQLDNGAVLSLNEVTGTTSLSLGGGLGGNGRVEAVDADTNLTVTVGKNFDPDGLDITAGSFVLTSSTTTTFDIPSAFVYDTVRVTGAMRNFGPLHLNIGSFNRQTGRTFALAAATGGITPGFSVVRINGTALTEAGTTGIWSGDVLDASNGRTYGYSYNETTGILSVTSGDDNSPLDDWFEANVTNPADRTLGADPDGDGLNNLVEYATGGDPMVAGPLDVVLGVSAGRLTLTFSRRADDGLTYTVEGADDLGGSWSTIAAGPGSTVINPSAGVANDRVTVVDEKAIPAPGRRFLRLKINHASAAQ